MAIKIAIAGAAGRMGRRLIALAAADAELAVVAAVESAESAHLGCDAGELAGVGRMGIALSAEAEAGFDVMIDFSTVSGTMRALPVCEGGGRGMVIGTTGHSAEQIAAIEKAAQKIPILKAANFSVGVNLLLGVVRDLARALDKRYDVEICETHHRFKKDAPSGTALALKDAIVQGRGGGDVVFGRSGMTGERPAGQIGMHSLRIGDAVGRHEVSFGGSGETISVIHDAQSRDTFAAGALMAAKWLAKKPPGLYDMQAVLGLDKRAGA
jgi:4-hydroxy-tetrahydrodipicolinate reductase